MSFFNNLSSDNCPGNIVGNPVQGICEKTCVQVKKVFDACLKQSTEDNVAMNLVDFFPIHPTYPLTFLSGKTASSHGQITSLVIEDIPDKKNLSRVKCNVTVPMEILYIDANNVEGKCYGTFTVHQDVVLYIPNESIMPYEIEAICSGVCPVGTIRDCVGVFTICFNLIMKVVMEVELLIPSYGYCTIPPCQEFDDEVCSGFFELPLFPNGRRPR